MAIRRASAEWKGTLAEGNGTMASESGAVEGAYSFSSRFESGKGSNPEELIAAAHAACFSMALSGRLTRAGHPPVSVKTEAGVHLEKGEAGFSITRIHLRTTADVPGISPEAFAKEAAEAKAGCPVSRALAAVPITLEASLV